MSFWHSFSLRQSPVDVAIEAYQGVENPVQEIVPQLLERENTDWTFAVLVVIFAAIAWIRVAYPRRFRQTFQTFIYNRFVRQTMREELVLSHGSSLVLISIFILTAGLFTMQLVQAGHLDLPFAGNPLWLIFLKVSGVIAVVYLAKLLVVRFLQFLFQTDAGFSEYIFNTFLINKVLGLLLLPCVIGLAFLSPAYVDAFIYAGLGLVSGAYIYRLVRGMLSGIAQNVSRFYLILYLCTLEILPLVVIFLLFSTDLGMLS